MSSVPLAFALSDLLSVLVEFLRTCWFLMAHSDFQHCCGAVLTLPAERGEGDAGGQPTASITDLDGAAHCLVVRRIWKMV